MAEVSVVYACGRRVNLTQLYRSTGITISALSRIFSGKRTPRLDTLMKISAYLNISMDDLVADLQEKKKNVIESGIKVT